MYICIHIDLNLARVFSNTPWEQALVQAPILAFSGAARLILLNKHFMPTGWRGDRSGWTERPEINVVVIDDLPLSLMVDTRTT